MKKIKLSQEATGSSRRALTKSHLPMSHWFQAAEGCKAKTGQAKDTLLPLPAASTSLAAISTMASLVALFQTGWELRAGMENLVLLRSKLAMSLVVKQLALSVEPLLTNRILISSTLLT